MEHKLIQITQAALCVAAVAALPAWADEAWSAGAGVEYSSGKYGSTSTTEALSVPVYLQYGSELWSIRLTVPYLQVTGDGSVIVSGGGMQGNRRSGSTTTTTKRTTESGLGDILLSAKRNLMSALDAGVGVDITGRVKFGTASKTMGSGLNDYAVQVATYTLMGRFSPGIMVGYEVLGDTTAQPLNDVYYGTLGGRYRFSDDTSAGVEYYYGQRASDAGADKREFSLYGNYRYAPYRFIGLYLMKGYSDGSPDEGAGVSLSAEF